MKKQRKCLGPHVVETKYMMASPNYTKSEVLIGGGSSEPAQSSDGSSKDGSKQSPKVTTRERQEEKREGGVGGEKEN